jgi:hypothetical protein
VSRGRTVFWTAVALCVVTGLVAASVLLPKWLSEADQPAARAEPAPPPATPKIKAHLFYVSEDGLRLVAIEREVPFGEGTVEQARRVVQAELDAPPPPLVSPIPAGTTLRGLYLSGTGEAYVDLSREVSAAHPGGSLAETLTVYALVNAVTANLPAVTSVQILVDGREVDTLAGHVDLRRPIGRSAAWVLN